MHDGAIASHGTSTTRMLADLIDSTYTKKITRETNITQKEIDIGPTLLLVPMKETISNDQGHIATIESRVADMTSTFRWELHRESKKEVSIFRKRNLPCNPEAGSEWRLYFAQNCLTCQGFSHK
jgi:hypothetical protein